MLVIKGVNSGVSCDADMCNLMQYYFGHVTLTDIFQVIYANCVVNVMRHSFAVPGSEQGRCGSLHPNKSVAGVTATGSNANAPFLKESSSVSNGYLRSGQWTTIEVFNILNSLQ